MISAVSRAYLRANVQAVPNSLKPAVLGTAQGKKVVVAPCTDKSLPVGNTRATMGLQSDY